MCQENRYVDYGAKLLLPNRSMWTYNLFKAERNLQVKEHRTDSAHFTTDILFEQISNFKLCFQSFNFILLFNH